MINELLQIGDLIVQNRYVRYLRVILTFLIICSATSYMYTWMFGEYELIAITNQTEITRFFLNGYFIRVALLFGSIAISTYLLGTIIYNRWNAGVEKWVVVETSRLNQFKSHIRSYKMQGNDEKQIPQLYSKWFSKWLHQKIKTILTSPAYWQFLSMRNYNELKNKAESYFIFLIRLIFYVLLCCFASIISWWIFIVIIIVIPILLFMIVILTQFCGVLPNYLKVLNQGLDIQFEENVEVKNNF